MQKNLLFKRWKPLWKAYNYSPNSAAIDPFQKEADALDDMIRLFDPNAVMVRQTSEWEFEYDVEEDAIPLIKLAIESTNYRMDNVILPAEKRYFP